jgi:hypothetical protein
MPGAPALKMGATFAQAELGSRTLQTGEAREKSAPAGDEKAPAAIAGETPGPAAQKRTGLVVAGAPGARANPEPAPAADTLLAETHRLREAHGALQGGDPEKALSLLDAPTAETEGQKLREERAAARVLALCKLGRVDEANAEAARFLEKNPRSPLAARVRKACPAGR